MDDKDMKALQDWIGRSESAEEVLSPVPARCLAATLDLPTQGAHIAALPPLWHWLYFPDTTPSSGLGEDGAPRASALMPPVPLAQLMWAGAGFEFFHPLETGLHTRKQSTLTDLVCKQGSRGAMVFVTWEHRYEQRQRIALIERQNAVFLGASTGAARKTEAPVAARTHSWLMNEAVLFRYSALTFNPHRIHYDLPYAREVGGYPGLVVHGPLQATLLAETFRAWHPDKTVRSAQFRARAPLYLDGAVQVGADDSATRLHTLNGDGGVAMECTLVCDADGQAGGNGHAS